jgi:hypothetical protein
MKPPKFNPWPWGIVAAFGLFVPATVGLMVVAWWQKDSLVRADYYDQEMRYQGQMERLERTRRLGTQVSVGYDPGAQHIRIALPIDHARQQAQGRIQLYRPSEAGLDRYFNLALDDSGTQFLDAGTLRPGLWKVRVLWQVANQEYALDEQVVVQAGPV